MDVTLTYPIENGANNGEKLRREREQESNFIISPSWVWSHLQIVSFWTFQSSDSINYVF